VSVLFALHHISVDAGTFDVLWRQVVERERSGHLPDLACSYAEHTDWQRRRDQRAAASYWEGQSSLRVPTARLGLAPPRPPEPDGYLSRRLRLAAESLALGRRTPFATSMAAVAIVLSRYTADERVAFGITASTKDHPDAAELVGYYLNTLPMEFSVGLGDRLEEVVERASALVTAALPHRTYPFASIVRDARQQGFAPPDVSFMLAYEDLATPVSPRESARQRILASGSSVADVTFFVQERGEGIQIGLEYRGSVISRADATRMLELFELVLTAVSAETDVAVEALVAQDLGPDLDGGSLPESAATVLERFLDCVERDPAAVAVIDADGSSVTFGALARAVLELTEQFDGVGAGGPGRRVGVSVGASASLVAAMLAAQFSGAAYVPLDPAAPPERLRRIIASSGLDALATGSRSSSALLVESSLEQVPLVTVVTPAGDDIDRAGIRSLRRRLDRLDPDDVAYVIFTSGSTGRPRGVEVSHRNLAASTAARDHWYDDRPGRFLLTSSIGFDSSIVGLYWPLAVGGAVVVPTDVHDVDKVAASIVDREVTHALMVPSLYRAVLDRATGPMPSLRVVIVAGEACPVALVERHAQLHPGVALVNEYGPTEASVWATAHRLDPRDHEVPIGRPIPGTTVRAVGPGDIAVPEGVGGELLISGPGVALGYLDDEAATEQRFVTLDGRRWYRTGDVVRFSDGLAHFLGRIDDQLNVGGHRLEPAELESELRLLAGVRDAVVVVPPGTDFLVAHLVADEFDEARARAALAPRVPAGWIPRRFVVHDRLPRNAHGKTDRAAAAALPHAVAEQRAGERPSVSAPDVIDVVLAAWRQSFARDDLDENTDFFEIGGDSLLAVQIVSAIGDALDEKVAIAALLAGRTPLGMAGLLGAPAAEVGRGDRSARDGAFNVVRLRTGSATGPFIVFTPAWDDVFGYRDLATAFPGDATVVALAYVESLDDRVVTTVDELVNEFLPRLVDLLPAGRDVALVGWSIGGLVAAELSERLRTIGHPPAVVALVDTFFPGEERHLWSNRWWKYKSLLRAGTLSEALRELRVMGRRRAQRAAAGLGRRLLTWSGTELPAEPARTSSGGFPVAALGHRIEGLATPVVFYAASTTNPARTTVRWRSVASRLEVVEVVGRHRGHDSIMGPTGAGSIARDLVGRLGAAQRGA
jgi:amino acid adenylation domain-containing protein